ncbi:hypothetical protein IMSAGC013_03620 [Lachnospiraceae bacterium]|nr:hypothetical protein IMSAGC013_03620 [Lachnospiraceae bacterium]
MERIPEKVLKAYEASESYQKLKKIRNDNSKILQGYYRKYKDSLSYFKKEAVKKLDHERYGTGMALPRGRLCPGNIEELIIGNIKRGRLSSLDKGKQKTNNIMGCQPYAKHRFR